MNLEIISSNMQSKIDKLQSGHCILVQLINYDELHATSNSANHTINELNNIIHNVCLKFSKLVYVYIVHDKVFILIAEISKRELHKCAFEIYAASQLYTSRDVHSNYMHCKIASIDFPKHATKAIVACNLLIGLISHFKNHNYYYQYDNQLHHFDIIRKNNIKLNCLRRAIIDKKVTFAYQPIIDRASMSIYYHECLLRIPDETGQLISVGNIIGMAENKGLINIIDQTVLKMAILELIKTPKAILSVNISNIGILDDNLLYIAKELFEQYNAANRLIIEITEHSLNEDYDKTKKFINWFHKFGCKFALDDFGSGFTTFKQLQNLPIDIIKIDGSYIKNIISNHQSQYFVEVLVKISEDLGIKTVAEFVENGEIAKFLFDIKVDQMQGNFFSPASSNRDIREL